MSLLVERRITENLHRILIDAGKVSGSPELQRRCFEKIERSKEDSLFAVNAANGISVLSRARVSLSGLPLERIRVPGADLTYAIFERTILNEADLNHARLVGASLRNAVCRGTILSEIYLGELPNLEGLRGPVHQLFLSKDQTWLLATSINGKILLWDLKKGKCQYQLRVADIPIQCAISPGNQTLLVCTPQEKGFLIVAYQLQEGVELWRQQIPSTIPCYVPDREELMILSEREGLQKIDALTGKVLQTVNIVREEDLNTFKELQSEHAALTMPCSTRLFVSGSRATGQNYCRLYQIREGEVLVFREGTQWDVSPCFSAKSQKVAYCREKDIHLWSIDPHKKLTTFNGHLFPIAESVFCPQGKILATKDTHHYVLLWDCEGGNQPINQFQQVSSQLDSQIFSQDSKQIVLGYLDGTIRVHFSRESGSLVEAIRIHTMEVSYALFTEQDKAILSAGKEDRYGILKRSVLSHPDVKDAESQPSHTAPVVHLHLDPESKGLFSLSSDHYLYRRDPKGFDGSSKRPAFPIPADLEGKISPVLADLTHLTNVWKLSKEKILQLITLPQRRYVGVLLKSTQRLGVFFNTLYLWTPEGEKKTQIQDSYITCLYQDRQDHFLLGDGQGRLWEWDGNEPNPRLLSTSHRAPISSISSTSNGRGCATAGLDRKIHIWERDQASPIKTFHTDHYSIEALAFSPDGTLLASGKSNGITQIWNVSTGNTEDNISAHTGGVRSLVFCDNRALISGGDDGNLCRWSITPSHLSWQTHRGIRAEEADLREAKGLSASNRLLLEQRGALVCADQEIYDHLTTPLDGLNHTGLELLIRSKRWDAIPMHAIQQALWEEKLDLVDRALQAAITHQAPAEVIDNLFPILTPEHAAEVASVAAMHQHLGLLQLLSRKDFDLNIPTSKILSPQKIAAREGFFSILEFLLYNPTPSASASPPQAPFRNAPADQTTPLMFAARAGNLDCLALLIIQGESINTPDQEGYTALSLAAEQGHAPCVQLLLSNGAKVIPGAIFRALTPIPSAASKGHLGTLHLLIEKLKTSQQTHPQAGRELNYAAALAIQGGHFQCVELLLAAGADPNGIGPDGNPLIFIAARWGRFEYLILLIQKGANLQTRNKNNHTPLLAATQGNHPDCLKLLLNGGNHNPNAVLKKVDKNDPNVIDALRGAAGENFLTCVNHLLAHGADPNKTNHDKETALFTGATAGSEECVATLLKHGADPNLANCDHATPLHAAAARGHLGCVRLLLTSRAHPRGDPRAPNTPFHISLGMGHLDCASALWEQIRDPNLYGQEGSTPAHVSAMAGRLKSLEFLHERGGNLDLPDQKPLKNHIAHIAAGLNDLPILNFLARVGIPLTRTNAKGDTPLHLAAARGHEGAVRSLLEHGADPHQKDGDGKTPDYLALANSHYGVYTLLTGRNLN